ncbi:hypothetical protein BpHYR1_020565 [Brachionus plicatilis]|uniref:Uncharacterized protein n=1 Tax=Brachionus plicatilis TaxID=10195 RepID=A0A3M7S8K0_BRAPC|nr:hypothetical protein BpHYR1_020565 [Brachionus plicatilis]
MNTLHHYLFVNLYRALQLLQKLHKLIFNKNCHKIAIDKKSNEIINHKNRGNFFTHAFKKVPENRLT